MNARNKFTKGMENIFKKAKITLKKAKSLSTSGLLTGLAKKL